MDLARSIAWVMALNANRHRHRLPVAISLYTSVLMERMLGASIA
jgi:hypothetical protein